jgi:hypothetical protein
MDHRCYDEQEQVIKDHDEFIIVLLAEVDREDDNDSDSGPDYDSDDDWGAVGDTKEDLREVPNGDTPQEQAPQPEPMFHPMQYLLIHLHTKLS